MKYSKEDALKEIKRRAKVIKEKHERRTFKVWASVACLSLIALFAVIGEFSGTEISGMQTAYGSCILSAKMGGFVLAAVLGFVLGVSVTLIVKYTKDKKKKK